MQVFDSIRELRNGERYDTASNAIMRESSCSESSPAKNSPETNENEVPKLPALTQDVVDELVTSFIAPFTQKLEDLTRLARGMATASHSNHYPRAGTSASCSAPESQHDNC